MALNWDISRVKNYEVLSIHPKDRERAAANPDGTYRWNPVTQALIWITLPIDIGQITEKNWREFYKRVYAYERLRGPFNREEIDGVVVDKYITAQDVYDHIGLSTNVGYKKSSSWASRLFNMIDDDVNHECDKIEGVKQ